MTLARIACIWSTTGGPHTTHILPRNIYLKRIRMKKKLMVGFKGVVSYTSTEITDCDVFDDQDLRRNFPINLLETPSNGKYGHTNSPLVRDTVSAIYVMYSLCGRQVSLVLLRNGRDGLEVGNLI